MPHHAFLVGLCLSKSDKLVGILERTSQVAYFTQTGNHASLSIVIHRKRSLKGNDKQYA